MSEKFKTDLGSQNQLDLFSNSLCDISFGRQKYSSNKTQNVERTFKIAKCCQHEKKLLVCCHLHFATIYGEKMNNT